MTDAVVVLVTVPSPEAGADIARALVEEGLAACGNVVPGVRSIYRWAGQIHDEFLTILEDADTIFPFGDMDFRVFCRG